MNENRSHLRFSLPDRIEHWLLFLSFTTLAVTGLVQKFSGGWYAQRMIDTMGGVETVRVIHRVAAVIMMLETVYHLGIVGYRLIVQRKRLTMLPGIEDARVALHSLMYNLGLRQDRPQQGRYTFEEKAEYWALIWGTVIMTITGFMLWNPVATTRILPGEIIPAAKAAHGAEAILAVLAIFVWHFYGVHIKNFNRSIFSGHLSEHEMIEEHPLELAAIKAGTAERPVDPAMQSRRRQVFLPVYGVLALAMLMGIYWFVTFEETAIATVPPIEKVAVFAPLTPTPLPTPLPSPTPLPTPTPSPTPEPGEEEPPPEAVTVVTWQDGIADIFESECGACHNESTKLGDLDLSSYQTAIAGGGSGSVIVPGDPAGSPLVALIESGNHPGSLTTDEMERVNQWITDGALEEPVEMPESVPSEPEPAPGVTWTDVADLFQAKCGACHSSATALGGLDVTSYQTTLEGGDSGPAVVPGAPDDSGLVLLQAQGEHPGQFSADELEQIRQWIAAGAVEN
jgi:formate dehydrogenase gamma subunit